MWRAFVPRSVAVCSRCLASARASAGRDQHLVGRCPVICPRVRQEHLPAGAIVRAGAARPWRQPYCPRSHQSRRPYRVAPSWQLPPPPPACRAGRGPGRRRSRAGHGRTPRRPRASWYPRATATRSTPVSRGVSLMVRASFSARTEPGSRPSSPTESIVRWASRVSRLASAASTSAEFAACWSMSVSEVLAVHRSEASSPAMSSRRSSWDSARIRFNAVQATLRVVGVCLGAGRVPACCFGCLSLSGDLVVNAAECLLRGLRPAWRADCA